MNRGKPLQFHSPFSPWSDTPCVTLIKRYAQIALCLHLYFMALPCFKLTAVVYVHRIIIFNWRRQWIGVNIMGKCIMVFPSFCGILYMTLWLVSSGAAQKKKTFVYFLFGCFFFIVLRLLCPANVVGLIYRGGLSPT